MSINKVNIKNLYKGLINDDIFMSAEIEVQADSLKSLTVDSMFPNTDVHVVISSSYDRALKERASSYPVSKNNIYLYDQQGNITNKWLIDREDNSTPVTIFKQIEIPDVPESSNLMVVLTDHVSMTECSSDFSKSKIIGSDLQEFYKKLNPLVNNYIVITSDIDKSVFTSEIPSELNVTKIVLDTSRLIPGISEILFGKTITSGPTSYQMFLNVAHEKSLEDSSVEKTNLEGISIWNNNSDKITLSLRSNGRIHITSFCGNVKCKFMAVFDGKQYDKLDNISIGTEKDCTVEVSSVSSREIVYSDDSLINLLNLHQLLAVVKLDSDMTRGNASIGNNDIGIQALMKWYSEVNDMECKEDSYDELFKKFYSGTIVNIIDRIINCRQVSTLISRTPTLRNPGSERIAGLQRFTSTPYFANN
jgi:hypothetical protein